MANNTVMIHMDKARNLKYTFNTLLDIEDDFGKPINEITGSMTMKDARKLIYHGLKWEDKKVTEQSTGELIAEYIDNGGSFQELMDIVSKAFTKSLGTSVAPSKK